MKPFFFCWIFGLEVKVPHGVVEPFVFLPEIAGEGNEQHRSQGPDAHRDHHPQRDGFTGGRVSGGQLHAFGAQLWLVPHIQPFLDRLFSSESLL